MTSDADEECFGTLWEESIVFKGQETINIEKFETLGEVRVVVPVIAFTL